jgi:L-cysteine S-thiosulfotransferase
MALESIAGEEIGFGRFFSHPQHPPRRFRSRPVGRGTTTKTGTEEEIAMAPSKKLLAAVGLLAASIACGTAKDPARGFRLAGSGDIQHGRAAFLEFGCNNCHEVMGANLPRPTVQPVVLGGSVRRQPSDGYLVTAIINPAYHAARYPGANGMNGSTLQMPDFASRMTVQQLTDLVAYLQTRYALSPLPVKSEYP